MDKIMDKKDYELISQIVKRAENKGLLLFDKLSLIMDIDCCMSLFDLKLEELLEADDMNFRHDIVGIQNNLNREAKQMENFFMPRFVR